MATNSRTKALIGLVSNALRERPAGITLTFANASQAKTARNRLYAYRVRAPEHDILKNIKISRPEPNKLRIVRADADPEFYAGLPIVE